MDDILVNGEGDTVEEAEADHDRHLHALLQRAGEKGLKFKPMKFKHRVGTVPFAGHRITADGQQVDPAKVSAVVNMPTPRPDSVAAIRRLMGMVNYMSRFLPGLSDMMEPLRKLTCQESGYRMVVGPRT